MRLRSSSSTGETILVSGASNFSVAPDTPVNDVAANCDTRSTASSTILRLLSRDAFCHDSLPITLLNWSAISFAACCSASSRCCVTLALALVPEYRRPPRTLVFGRDGVLPANGSGIVLIAHLDAGEFPYGFCSAIVIPYQLV